MNSRADWLADCMHWHARLLMGKFSHWCTEWDDLPIDETCYEFVACSCFPFEETKELKRQLENRNEPAEDSATGW